MLYDDVLKEVGEFGRYQKTVLFISILLSFTSGPTQLSPLFLLATPNHRCAIPGYDNDTYEVQNDYHSFIINQSIPQSSSCMLRNLTDNPGNESQEYKCDTWVYDESVFTSTLVTEFNLVCDNAVYQTNAVMILFVGLLIGYSTLSSLADIFGRKPLLVTSNFVFVISTYLLIWTPNYAFLLCVRFMIGLSMSGQVLALYIIGLEFVGPNQRIYAGVLSFFTWCGGSIILVTLAYFIRDWRHLQIALAIYVTYALFYFLMMPESPRWLLTRGYNSKAREIILKAAKVNKVELKRDILKDITVTDKVTKVKFWRIFTIRRLCIRTVIIYFTWFAASITFYGILLNLNVLAGNIYLNLLINVSCEIISYITVILTVDRVGRKRMLCGCLVIAASSLTSCIFIMLFAPQDLRWLTTPMALFGQFGASSSFCVLWFWTGELFPTELRNTGTGTSSAIGRIGSIIAPYIGYMSKNVNSKFGSVAPFIVYSTVCVVALTLATIVLPETSHITLPETIEDCNQLGRGFGKNKSEKKEVEAMNMLEKGSKGFN